MGMVAPQQRIASAFFVIHGQYGDVSRYAEERGVCRQWVYREAAVVTKTLAGPHKELTALRAEVLQLRQSLAELQGRLAQAVVIDAAKQTEVASFGQARGVTLRDCWAILDLLIPGKVRSVASLGRATQAAGKKAGQLLAVLDEVARSKVREAAADEIYVKDPVLMVVEPESLCWLSGQLSDKVDGEAWEKQFAQLPNLEQAMVDGGLGLGKGVERANEQRRHNGQSPIVYQGDHFHALWQGGRGVHYAEKRTHQAFAQALQGDQELARCERHGTKQTGAAVRASRAWKKAEKAMDAWQQVEHVWRRTKEALRLHTPTGELNTRRQAEAELAEMLPQLPQADFAKVKRQLQKPEMFNYLDHTHEKLAALAIPDEIKQAAIRQEGLRRRPDALQGDSPQAAVRRGIMLMCAVVLSKADAVGTQAVTAVRDIFRRAYRTSSLVECINSVLRMHQAGHRQMTQGMLDLKRLYWNCHRFSSGRRRKTTPYERLGLVLPTELRWWDLLKLTPEQLKQTLSTAKMAA
jgi:hypothetical protein